MEVHWLQCVGREPNKLVRHKGFFNTLCWKFMWVENLSSINVIFVNGDHSKWTDHLAICLKKRVPNKMGEQNFWKVSELHGIFIIILLNKEPLSKGESWSNLSYSILNKKQWFPFGRLEFLIPEINFDDIYIYIKFVVNMKYFPKQFHQEIWNGVNKHFTNNLGIFAKWMNDQEALHALPHHGFLAKAPLNVFRACFFTFILL
jgi:hypothetical protein